MRNALAFLGLCGAAALCWALGHRQGQRVPLLGGHRCVGCRKVLPDIYVDVNRKTFYRPEKWKGAA